MSAWLVSPRARSSGSYGWVAVALGVIAWDVFADETMSSAFERALRRPGTRPFVVGAWCVLTAHLFDVLPARADPFEVFLHGAERLRLRDLVNA